MNVHERTKLVMDIGDAAADHELDQERSAHIDQACRGDLELKKQVLDYLCSGEDLFVEPAILLREELANPSTM